MENKVIAIEYADKNKETTIYGRKLPTNVIMGSNLP